MFRSAMCAASQLPGRGPTDVDDSPCASTLIKNLVTIGDMMTVCKNGHSSQNDLYLPW